MKCFHMSLAIALASALVGQTIRTVAGGGPVNGVSAASIACDGACDSVAISPSRTFHDRRERSEHHVPSGATTFNFQGAAEQSTRTACGSGKNRPPDLNCRR